MARGGPLCLSPSLRLHLFPPFASVGLFSPCLCPPSCSSFSPLSPAPLCLSTSGAHRSLWALSAHPASVRPLLLSTAVARRFLHVLSVYLFLRLLLHLLFPPPLSACLSPTSLCPLLLSTSVARRFLCVLAACLFADFSPPVFSFASRRPSFSPAFVRPSFPLASVCTLFSTSVCPLFLSPVTRRSLWFAHLPFSVCLFPSPLSAQFSSPPLHPPISLHLLSIPLFPVPVRPPGRKEGRPLDI